MSTPNTSSAGTYQHYLPAAFLGRFSWDAKKRPRNRPLWVFSVEAPRPYVNSASKVAGEVGLYDVADGSLGDNDTVDTAWGYERSLPQALDNLEQRRHEPLDGRQWLTAAVPFVAGLFARGPEFQQEFSQRLPPEIRAGPWNRESNATQARLIDLQILLAPIMAARWAVVHFSSEAELVTSDRGYALTTTPAGELPSYVVPISRQSALVITPCRDGAPLTWTGERWVAEVEHYDAGSDEVPALNRAIGGFARHAIFGPTQSAVEAAASDLGAADRLTAGLFEIVDPASHLYDYFRVLAVLGSAPADEGPLTGAIDWSSVSETGWSAPIVVEGLFPERTTGGVSIRGNQLAIDLTYGIEQRRVRKASGDFRMGALSLIALSALEAAEHRVDKPAPSAGAGDVGGRRQIALEDHVAPSDDFDRGNALLERGDHQGAEQAFRRADKLGNAAASVNLGNLRGMAGDLNGAKAAFQRAARRGNSNGTLNLGVLLRDQGDLRRAEKAFRRADGQGNATAPAYLGALLQDRGDLGGAEAAYRRADARGNEAGALGLADLLRIRGDNAGADQALARARARHVQSQTAQPR